MLDTFQIRFEAIESHNRENFNLPRYSDELKMLRKDIARFIEEDNSPLGWLYKRISQEISWISASRE